MAASGRPAKLVIRAGGVLTSGPERKLDSVVLAGLDSVAFSPRTCSVGIHGATPGVDDLGSSEVLSV
jgi:hypothetical protein